MQNIIADQNGRPTKATKVVASAVVGVAAGAVITATFRTSAVPALVVMLFVYLMHQKFDAPAARAIVGAARDVGLA